MPITAELDNLNKFEVVGFSHEQAKTLAEVIEQGHHDSHQDLKEFFRAELKASQSDLLMKIFGIIVGSISIAVAIIKITS